MSAPAFIYSNTGTIALGDFGITTAIYYRQYQWQCQDRAAIISNSSALKVNFADPGRYKFDVVAYARVGTCDTSNVTPDEAGYSPIYTTNDFMVIPHDKLDYEINGTVQATFAQNPNPQTVTGKTGQNNAYDLHLTWPTIAGSEQYQITVVKDGVEHTMPTVTPATYAADIANNGHYTIADTYDAATQSFSAHTGFGAFQFKLRYQLAGVWSDSIAYSSTLNIDPEQPRFFITDDKASLSTLPQDVVAFKWQADSRTKYFKVMEQNLTTGSYQAIDDILPGPSTIIRTRDDGADRFYDHWIVTDEINAYSYRYSIFACADKACTNASGLLHNEGGNSVSPIQDPANSAAVAMAKLLDSKVVVVDEDVVHGEYEEPTASSGGSNFWSKLFGGESENALPSNSGNEISPGMNNDIFNRLQVDTSITPETTGLLGEQIDLASGSLTFTHTDVSIPGSSQLPVAVTRSHQGSSFNFQHKRELGDWKLDTPHIHTNVMRSGAEYSNGWGIGKACSQEQGGDFSYDSYGSTTVKNFEYFNGTTLSIPGVTQGKLLDMSPSSGRTDKNAVYYTQDNWKISCLAPNETVDGIEGFKATSPNGTQYYFDQLRLIRGNPVRKGLPRLKYNAFMMVSKIEDRFGNIVHYNYTNGYLTSIVGQDVAESTPRKIDLHYSSETNPGPLPIDTDELQRVTSVTANPQTTEARTWHYGYTDGLLTTVTRPDNKQWQFNFAAYNKMHPLYNGGFFCLFINGVAEQAATITHPNGATGVYTFNNILHGRSNTHGYWLSGTGYVLSACHTNISVTGKSLTGPGLSPMNWQYRYSSNTGFYVKEEIKPENRLTGTLPGNIDDLNFKSTTVVAPDNSKTVHYFNRSMTDVAEGKEFTTDYYDTDGTTLLKRIQRQYAQGLLVGHGGPEFDNGLSLQHHVHTTQVEQQLYHQGNATRYITDFSDFNEYGVAEQSHGYNTMDNKHRYTRNTYIHDTNSWVLNLNTKQELTDDLNNWPTTPASETTYYSVGSGYDWLPEYEKSFGQWVKRNVSYNGGNLTKVEYNTLMNNGAFRYEQFGNFKRGKAQTITLPGRYNASQTISAQLTVDNNGWVKNVVDFNGYSTGYQHDSLGRIIKVIPSSSKWLSTDLSFELVSGTDIQGDVKSGMYKQVQTTGDLTATSYFDALLRPILVKTSDTKNNVHRYQRKTFNQYDKPVFEAYPANHALETHGMQHTFDGLQRIINTKQTATNANQTIAYLSGHKTQVNDYNGNTTTTHYLSYGEPQTQQMVQMNSPEGVTTSQVIDVLGNVQAITQDNVTEYRFYDSQQRLCKIVRPETNATILRRDTLGAITGIVKGSQDKTASCVISASDSQQLITYTRDNLGGNHTIDYNDNSGDISYTLDNQGNLTKLVAGDVTQNYTYYAGGVVATEQMLVDGKSFNLSYNYNGNQAMTQMTYPDGLVISFIPNAYGAPTRAGNYANNVLYFPDGQIQSFTFGNGLTHSKALNASKMPSAIVDSNSAMDYSYTYDSMGNLTSQTDHLDAAYNITNMMYDGLDRLTSAKGFWGDVSIGYDKLGNITNYNFTDKGTTGYQYNADNLLATVTGGVSRSFTYDGRGNVTANGKNTFTYNHANRMASSNVASYIYDGHGRRVKNTGANGTDYSFYDKAGRLVYRQKSNAQEVNYVFLNKLQVARVESATANSLHDNKDEQPVDSITTNQALAGISRTAKYIHTDLLGSPVVESNQAGQVLTATRMHYRPFGQTKEATKDEVGYTGHKFDTDIGLVYAQQRYYDSEIGRFYADDPLGFRDVHSFNRYTYANNNPYKYIDPTGMKACEGQSGSKCIEADPVNDKLASKPDVQGTSSTDATAVNNMSKFAVKKGTTEKGGYIKDGEAVAPSDVQTGQTAGSYTASISVPTDADAVIHGHPDVDPSGINSPGDANAPLNYGKPNYVVTKGRVGVTELVGGKIRVRMVKGKMTRKERRALQKNINKQQTSY